MLDDVRLGRTTLFIVALVVSTAIITGGVLFSGMSQDIRRQEKIALGDALDTGLLRFGSRTDRLARLTEALIEMPP